MLELICRNMAEVNCNATLIEPDLPLTLEPGITIADKRVVVVEDGPTLARMAGYSGMRALQMGAWSPIIIHGVSP